MQPPPRAPPPASIAALSATVAIRRKEWGQTRVDPAVGAVAALTLVAVALRVHWLGQSFWLDEALTANIVRSHVADMVHDIAHQAESPLYFFVTSALTRVFGLSEVSVRFVSFVAGIATVPAGYAAVRALVGRRAGVAAAALIATSPFLAWYGVEGRAYALWVFLSVLALLFWARARDGVPRWSHGAWAVASLLAFATHYFAVLLIVPQAIWLLARTRDRDRAIRAVVGLALGGAILLPLVLYQRAHGGAEWIALNALGARLTALRRWFTGVTPPPGWIEVVVPILWVAAIGLAIWRGDRRVRRGVLIIAGLLAAALAIAFAGAATGNDFILDRNLLALWLLFAGLIAAAAGARGLGGLIGAALVLAVCGLFVWQDLRSPSMFQRDDWRGVAKIIGPRSADRMVVLAPKFEQPALTYYAPGLNPTALPHRVREVDAIVHFGGNPWPDPLRPAKPGPPFKPYGRLIPVLPRTLVARFRAPRPTLVTPRSLTTRGRAGSIVLAWPR